MVGSFVQGFKTISQPDLIPRNNRGQFVLKEDAIYEWFDAKTDPGGLIKLCRTTIFRGFITDIASVPAWCAVLGFTPDGPQRAGAVLHDLLYQLEGRLRKEDTEYRYEESDISGQNYIEVERDMDRSDCDEMFKQAMIATGTFGYRAWVMHKAVNIFGRLAW